jgi:phenylalanyl-tRNA synthetase beta chain
MKLTHHWLKRYCHLNSDIEYVIEKLPFLGIEVEDVHFFAKDFERMCVGKIERIEPHPKADRLNVCYVNIGDNNLVQVVCGAKNARSGLVTAFAHMGAIIPSTKTPLKKGMIRGVESFGMLCSQEELGLLDSSGGIMELDGDLIPGTPLCEVLNQDDTFIDVSLTPNRGDCFSIKGIARDVVAAGLGSYVNPFKSVHSEKFQSFLSYIYGSASCFALIQMDISSMHAHSLSNHLVSVGQKLIHPAVDLTNFMMLECGQPFHAYDAALIKGQVRLGLSKGGESFEALNDITYTLPPNAIVIEDDGGIIALAGIIGGKTTACSSKTKHVLLEAGIFDPIAISKAGQALHLTTDAKMRFERGVDQGGFEDHLRQILTLFKEAGATIQNSFIHMSAASLKRISFDHSLIFKMTGVDLTLNQVCSLLSRLQMSYENGIVTVPTYRHDISIPEDIVEEVLRIYGYDHLKSCDLPVKSAKVYESSDILSHCYALGYQEVMTFSFTKHETSLPLQNPLSKEWGYMRDSIIPSLLEHATSLMSYGQESIKILEQAPVYSKEYDLYQTIVLAGLCYGKKSDKTVINDLQYFDFFDIKGDVEVILKQYGIKNYQLEPCSLAVYHPYQSATIKLGKQAIGHMGAIHPKSMKKAFAFELFLEKLPKLASFKIFDKPSIYPKVVRDFCFIFKKQVSFSAIEKHVYKVGPFVKNVHPFDLYGDSIAFRVTFQSNEKTLSEDEANDYYQKVITTMESLGLELKL